MRKNNKQMWFSWSGRGILVTGFCFDWVTFNFLFRLGNLWLHVNIPHICHFFYTGRIFESQFFTPKNYEKHPKITTNCPKKYKICSFPVQSGKFYTREVFFTQALPVVPVTNMRYACHTVSPNILKFPKQSYCSLVIG